MLSLSRKTDYALLILTALAGREHALVSLRTLAQELHIPYRFAGTVMRSLIKHGLVESKEGAHGGYKLAKIPSHITVRDVVVAVEGGVAMTDCLDSEKYFACERKHTCSARQGISGVQNIVLQALSSRSIADIVREGEGV